MAIGIMDLPKAPAGITPAKFFEEWLPTQVAAFKDMIGALGAGVSVAMSCKVIGAGEWSMVLADGTVKIEKGLRSDALMTAVMEERNFIEAITGKMDDVMLAPPGTENLTPDEAAAKAKENLEAVKEVSGILKVAIEDANQPFWAMVKFGGGELKDEPDVTVTMDRDTAVAVAKGETNPQAAFMSGRVQIAGDLSILMQISPLLMQ
jgi:putative sterol carrier protein